MTSPVAIAPETTFQAYADRGRHAIWRYLLTPVLAIVVEIIAVVILVFILAIQGEPLPDLLQRLQDPAHAVYFFSMIGVSFFGLALGVALSMPLLHGKRPADLLGNWKWSLFFLGLGVWLGVLLVITAIDYVLKPGGFSYQPEAFKPAMALLIVGSLFIQTFAEEYIFRGYITQGLLKLIRRPWIVSGISGLIFGALHLPNGRIQAISATLLGIALAWIAIRTGSLAFGFGLHLINNAFGAIVIVSANDVFKGAPALFTQSTPGLDRVDLATVTIALIAMLVVMARRWPAAPTTS